MADYCIVPMSAEFLRLCGFISVVVARTFLLRLNRCRLSVSTMFFLNRLIGRILFFESARFVFFVACVFVGCALDFCACTFVFVSIMFLFPFLFLFLFLFPFLFLFLFLCCFRFRFSFCFCFSFLLFVGSQI